RGLGGGRRRATDVPAPGKASKRRKTGGAAREGCIHKLTCVVNGARPPWRQRCRCSCLGSTRTRRPTRRRSAARPAENAVRRGVKARHFLSAWLPAAIRGADCNVLVIGRFVLASRPRVVGEFAVSFDPESADAAPAQPIWGKHTNGVEHAP